MNTLTEDVTDIPLTKNFTAWWGSVYRRPDQCKDSACDGWDAGVDECLIVAESMILNTEFPTDYSRGYNRALEELIDTVKRMVR